MKQLEQKYTDDEIAQLMDEGATWLHIICLDAGCNMPRLQNAIQL